MPLRLLLLLLLPAGGRAAHLRDRAPPAAFPAHAAHALAGLAAAAGAAGAEPPRPPVAGLLETDSGSPDGWHGLGAGSPHHVPAGHVHGGHVDPDLTLRQFLDEEGHEHKLELVGDTLAGATAALLDSVADHHDARDALHAVAWAHAAPGAAHGLMSSFLDEGELAAHGLRDALDLDAMHGVTGALADRILEKVRRTQQSKPKSSSSCPTRPELDENEGGNVVADMVGSDTKSEAEMTADPAAAAANFDPAAVSAASGADLETDRESLQKAQETLAEVELVTAGIGTLEKPNPKGARMIAFFQRTSTSSAQADKYIDQLSAGMSWTLGNAEQDAAIIAKFKEVVLLCQTSAETDREKALPGKPDAGTAQALSLIGSITDKVAAGASQARGQEAVRLILEGLALVRETAVARRDAIYTQHPELKAQYEGALAASEAAADDQDLPPDQYAPPPAPPGGAKPSLGVQIKALFAKEWKGIKAQGGPIMALLTYLKIGIGWNVPVTVTGLLNPSLPGIGVVCAPIAPCLSRLLNAGKAIMNAIWKILVLPLKVLWLVIKAVLQKIGGAVMKWLGKAKTKTPPAVEEVQDASAEGEGGDAAAAAEETAKPGFDSAPVPTGVANLVSIQEDSSTTWSACKLCNLKLAMSFALGLMDCMLGFGLSAFKVNLGTIPQNGPTLLKCTGACLKLALKALKPQSKQRKVEIKYWQETCTPHSVGMCVMLARTRQCNGVWSAGGGDLGAFVKASGGKGANMCTTIPESTKIAVAKSNSGELICPLDAPQAWEEWRTGVNQDACHTQAFAAQEAEGKLSDRLFKLGAKGSADCAVMSLRSGCDLVREKMNKEEKARVKTCGPEAAWGHPSAFASAKVPQVDVLFEQCMDLYKCSRPSLGGETMGANPTTWATGAGKQLDTEKLMAVIQQHMDSMDCKFSARTRSSRGLTCSASSASAISHSPTHPLTHSRPHVHTVSNRYVRDASGCTEEPPGGITGAVQRSQQHDGPGHALS